MRHNKETHVNTFLAKNCFGAKTVSSSRQSAANRFGRARARIGKIRSALHAARRRPIQNRGLTRLILSRKVVRILIYNRALAGQLRAIFPVLIERLPSRGGHRNRCFADALSFGGVKPEAET
jgi:hypothetical protein